MHTQLELLMQTAEDHYLRNLEMLAFKVQIKSLRQRLEVYELLRDNEVAIFQPIADKLVVDFASENPKIIENALKHWIAILRYSTMAMLQNNPTFLQHRLLEWLTPTIKAHQMQPIERKLYQYLQSSFEEILSPSQIKLLQPFLTQAEATLLSDKASTADVALTRG